MTESSPPTVYKPHPKKPGIYQKFRPTITIVEDPTGKNKKGKKEIDFGDCLGEYRRTEGDEKPDIMLFSDAERKVVGYVEVDYMKID